MAHAADGPVSLEHMPRQHSAAAPIAASVAPAAPRRSALPRALAAGVLVVLLGATGLVFTTSRPLADVDIEAVTLTQAPCRGAEPCPGPRRASVRGTVAASSATQNATVLVLVRTGSHGEWSVVAEAQPDENGDWRVADLVVPPEAGSTLEVRAVVSAGSGRAYSEREVEAGMTAAPASRVVRVVAKAPAIESAH